MCGITGFHGKGTRSHLEAMTDALAHRGPDANGYYVSENQQVYLGHRRLSIIDLTFGAQPMWDRDQSICIVFNGEIYNHQDLRRELETKGHVFQTSHSDTEVLIYGYKEWGKDLPLKLNGMFAFCIWDVKAQIYFMARDRFGEKPLYWSQQKDLFLFASELTALTKHALYERDLNPLAIYKYFAHGYIPSPNSLYKNTYKLKAGHSLTYHLQSQKADIECYWKFRIEPMDNPPSLEEAAEDVKSLLVSSVKARMISNVPLGVFLSGGIDSSAIAACASLDLSPYELSTFSIGFEEKSYDESVYARQVAEALKTKHHEKILDMSTAHRLIPEILSRLDEPFGDPSIIPTYMLSKFTREQVTVALSGDGGDELFAGYDPFAALAPAQFLTSLTTQSMRKGMVSLAQLLPVSKKNMSFDFKVKRGLGGLLYPQDLWNPVWLSPIEAVDFQAVLSTADDFMHEKLEMESLYSEALSLFREDPKKSVIDKSMEFYTVFYLGDGILTKSDRASMMNSLETRAPFLDNHLVDYVRKLPSHYKYDKGQRKILLKKAVEGLIPDFVLHRKKKGFGIPLQEWLGSLDLPKDEINMLDGFSTLVNHFIKEQKDGKANRRLFLWCWLVFWYQYCQPSKT